ncbi:MAG: 5-oxoprolinase subunit PxpA [Gemmataceae bacterium]
MEIDLNCDLGEGFPYDTELAPLVTSANVACGGHAGDLTSIGLTLRAAAKHGVQVGAHPGFLDREHFGRRELSLPEKDVLELCRTQIAYLKSQAAMVGVTVRYVKPHGALYNLAFANDQYARPVIEAAAAFGLAVVGLPGSRLQALAAGRCPYVIEGFADRRYLDDGTLVPRSRPDAFVETPEEAVRQAHWLIRDKGVQTLCVHGDNPLAVKLVKALRQDLEQKGYEIRSFPVS